MSEIVLATLNARYSHTSFGLRCLRANLGALRERSEICEFTINDRPVDIVEKVLQRTPTIVGFGVYVWNVEPTAQVVALLRRLRPSLKIVLGGPEVSFERDAPSLVSDADHIITGEGEDAFRDLADRLLSGRSHLTKYISGGLPDLTTIVLPYEEYTDHDIAHRVAYVEASRGCPFRCEFCLSSLDQQVRQFPIEGFLAAMERLRIRGVREFKFIDRTFNLNIRIASAILEFFRPHAEELFLHFEMVPDRLPTALRDLIAAYPPGHLQFEIGVQTFDPAVAERIDRRQDFAKLEENFRFLAEETGVHTHADLIIGLPGEDTASFAAGFDRLRTLGPHEIQVGILKRLRGAPIAKHTEAYAMVYSPIAPYELLENAQLSFAEMQRLKRFARAWDLVGNSGNFRDTLNLLLDAPSAFGAFADFAAWLAEQVATLKAVSLPRLAELLLVYLVESRGLDRGDVGATIAEDYARPGRRLPGFLLELSRTQSKNPPRHRGLPSRQARHHS